MASFNPESLKIKTNKSTAGGGFTGIRVLPKSWAQIAPLPDVDNPELTSGDYVPISGKSWIYLFCDDYEIDPKQTQGDSRFSNAFTSTIIFHIPGNDPNISKAINEGVFNEECYLLVDHCKDIITYNYGKGKCCAGKLKFNQEQGKIATDKNGWTATYEILQEGVNTIYKGVGAINMQYQVAADDATPDVSKGTATYLLPSNVAATEITDLDNAVAGSLITLIWTGTTNLSTITSGATFQLAGAITPVTGTILVLQATTASTFAERYRKVS